MFALALLLLATIGGSIAYRDDDFEEFDDEEVEFDFDVDDSEDQGEPISASSDRQAGGRAGLFDGQKPTRSGPIWC